LAQIARTMMRNLISASRVGANNWPFGQSKRHTNISTSTHLNGHHTNLTRNWHSNKANVVKRRAHLQWRLLLFGMRTSWTRVIDSTWNQVSAQRGITIVELVCFLTLLTLFVSKYFRLVLACIQITENEGHHRAVVQLPPLEEGTQLARNCTPRALWAYV
jgi:hypothetical protein